VATRTQHCDRDRDRDALRALHLRARDNDPEAVNDLVARYQGLARSAALRMSRSSNDVDDLIQVANYGLLNALRRFDPDRGVQFSTFAYATIEGELKRYRRQTAWVVHVPRSLQERALTVDAEIESLTTSRGSQPTVADVAESLGIDEAAVIEVLDVRDLRRPASLDLTSDDGSTVYEVPTHDGGFDRVDAVALVRDLMERLSEREREVVELRFFEQLKQSDIAAKVGLSQMHVSRILRTAIARLRVLATYDA
jgi:RNA polymerase sigma-B factor